MECEDTIVKLIPLLSKFLNLPSKENLDPLKNELGKTECPKNQISGIFAQQKYQTFIYQLIFQLTKLTERENELKVDLIDCINSLIVRTRINDINMVKTLITIILTQIHDFEKSIMKPNISEELKYSSVVCLSNILKCTDNNILELFYVKEMCIILGKICVTCVSILINEKYRNLKLAAIKCIMTAFYVHNEADFNDIVLRKQVADTMFLFLPKIASTLIKIVIGDSKQGENLITSSLQCFGRILVILFEDEPNNTKSSSYETQDFQNLVEELITSTNNKKNDKKCNKKSSNTNLKDAFLTQQSEGRNVNWRSQIMDKLKVILQPMSLLRANPSSKIRYEYGLFCINIVEKCSSNLANTLKILVESIIALSMDENESIKKMCAKCIKKIHKQSSILILYEDNIEKLFDDHLTCLPRIIYRSENSEQIAEFLFLQGLLKNLTNNEIKRIFMCPGNLTKFCMCLISAFNLTLHNDLLTEEYALRTFNQISDREDNYQWRIFKHIQSKKAVELLKEICITLGKSFASRSIFDYLIELLDKNIKFSNEIILILTFLTSGDTCNKENRDIAFLLLESILNEKRWHLALTLEQKDNLRDNKYTNWFVDRTPGLYESAIEIRTSDVQSDDEDPDEMNIIDVKFNVLHTCILLEALGNLALYLGEDFQSFAFSSLYRVLLKTGSSNYCVHLSSKFALNCIQKALNFTDTSELVHYYSDYIVYHINYFMKRTNESKLAIELLSVILSFSSMGSLPHLENIIYTLLNECTKASQNANITSFLKVFHIFLTSIGKWSDDIFQELNVVDKTSNDFRVNIFDTWMEILTRNKYSNNDDILNNENVENFAPQNPTVEDENIEEEKSEDEKLSSNIKIVRNILNEVLKFVSSKVRQQRILALECLIAGIPQLRNHENELLPLVHLIWYPFTERFKVNDCIILNHSFMLLEVLAKYSKDFILQRSLKDVLPVLNRFLRESAKRSECDAMLTPTQELMLQKTLLKGYANVIKNLNLQTKNLSEICDAIRLYLNKKQPEILQKSAIQFFKDISFYNRPLMYLCLIETLNAKEFKQNVNIILDFIKTT